MGRIKPNFALKPERGFPFRTGSSMPVWNGSDYSKAPKFNGWTAIEHQGGRVELFDTPLVSRIRTNTELIRHLYEIAYQGKLPGDLPQDEIAELERQDPYTPLPPGWNECMPWPEGAPTPSMGGRAQYMSRRAYLVWDLIEACDHAVRLVDHEYAFQGQPPAKERDKLADVADKARRLRLAMQALEGIGVGAFQNTAKAMAAEGLHLHSGAANMADNAQAGHMLGSMWDVIDDLEKVAQKASERVNVQQKTEVPSRMAWKLTKDVIGGYRGIFKELPMVSTTSWFVQFMEALGKGVKLSCGHRTVCSALNDMAGSNTQLLRGKPATAKEN